MMKRLTFRTRIEMIMALILIIFIISVVTVTSLTRTISDSYDNSYLLIRNSNGNFWEATGNNIQNAIDDLSSGGTVYLPNGKFTVSSPISLSSDISLVGEGIGSTIIEMNSAGNFPTGCLYLYQVKQVTLSDFSVDGNKDGGAAGNMVYVSYDCDNISISRLRLFDGNNAGLRIVSDNVHVEDIFVQVDSDSNNAVTVSGSHNSILRGVTAINPSLAGVDLPSCDNCVLSDFIIRDSAFGMKIPGEESKSNNLTLNNFQIYNISTGYGLRLENCYDISLSNFMIKNIYSLDAIVTYSTAHNLLLNNININNAEDGIDVNAENVIISNSMIRGCSDNGIEIDNDNVNIDNCIIRDCSDGIYIEDGSKHWKVTDTTSTSNDNSGISINSGGNTDYFIINGCNFIGNSGSSINDNSGASNSVITDNLT